MHLSQHGAAYCHCQTACGAAAHAGSTQTGLSKCRRHTAGASTHRSQDAEASRDAPGQKPSAMTGPSCAASTSSRRPVLRDQTKIWNESLLPAHTTWWGVQGGRK